MLVPSSRSLILGLALAATACSNSGLNLPQAPTATPAVAITETFDGSLTVNGAATHPFAAQRAGTVSAQITILGPDETATIGLSLGTWNGTACQVVLANDGAILNTTLLATAQTAANLCVRVYDVGKLSAPAEYQLLITHSA